MKKIINKKTLLLLSLLLFLPLFSGCFLTPSVNQTPTIISTPITTATVAVAYAYTVNATDPDGDTRTYSLTVNPTGMTIDPTTGVISWTPTSTQSGDHSVTVEVSDGSLSATQSFTIIVSKVAIIHPPTPPVVLVSAITITTDPVEVTGVVNNGTVTVTLATVTTGAEIRYTTDGSTPTASSALYSAPFSVTTANSVGETIVVKAMGIKAGYTNSAIAEKAIVFSAVALKEITGFTALTAVDLATDEHLVDLAALKLSAKLPTTVTVTDGTTPTPAAITDWTGTFDGTTTGAKTLTAVWTMPTGYVDAVDPITVTIIVTVSTAQTVALKEITGFTALTAVDLDTDENLVDLAALKVSAKLPITVTVTDGTTPAPAAITNWTGTFDGTTGEKTLTAVWTIPAGYVDAVDPITVTITVNVNTAQTVATPEEYFAFDNITGTITDYYPTGLGEDLPEVLNVVIPSTIGGVAVTTIGDYAFEYNQLTSVIIPSGVTSIGSWAFADNLLTSVIIPDSVTSINAGVFATNLLTSVIIPSGVTSIGSWAFAYNLLTSVTIPSGVKSIGINAFYNNLLTSVTIPSGVTSISNSAFAYNLLTSVIIPDSVTSIGDHAFRSNQLTSVTIPNSVTSIGAYAFASNVLTSIIIPNSVKSISDGVFANNKLTSVTIGNLVTSIGNSAFYSNPLTSVTIPNFVTSIGTNAFSINALTSVTIPNSVTSIGAYAFASNVLTSIIIGDDVVIAGNEAMGTYGADFLTLYSVDKAGTYNYTGGVGGVWGYTP